MLIFPWAVGVIMLPFLASFFSIRDGSLNKLSYLSLNPPAAILFALVEMKVDARLFYLECLDFLSTNRSPTFDGEILGWEQ
jgi:hypothetical protein